MLGAFAWFDSRLQRKSALSRAMWRRAISVTFRQRRLSRDISLVRFCFGRDSDFGDARPLQGIHHRDKFLHGQFAIGPNTIATSGFARFKSIKRVVKLPGSTISLP